ncbi:hypothetical protein DFH06DRAFT_1126979 [Mycena polygramma]|nr:hypothetical protein DFH06DRAFT_1137798 [Mycena polygramma]KAJ7666959.1 hypothetical protein DFH06DRAFT_1126979 [Mycena polygramma]
MKHLKAVDTTRGPVNEVIFKFQLTRDVEMALHAFIRHHGCTMVTRILSREEQNAVDRRRKSCAQHTSVLVTPEAQAAFLNKSSGIGREIVPNYEATALHIVPRSPSNSDQSAMMSMGALLAKFISPEIEEQMVGIPGPKIDAFAARISEVVRLLPTTNSVQGKRYRNELVDIAHELRLFRP